MKILLLAHMRDRSRYEKHLRQFCQQHGVACRALIPASSTSSSRQQRGVDCSDVHLVVVGPGGGVKGFMRALRSHKVDVDGARKPCLERKATALYEGTMAAPRRVTRRPPPDLDSGEVARVDSSRADPECGLVGAPLLSFNSPLWTPGLYSATAAPKDGISAAIDAATRQLGASL